MTVIILIVAILSLSAGFYLLVTGRRNPESGKPADHKVNIRKAISPALLEVKDSPPEGLSELECAAADMEEEDPIDIFLDFDLSYFERINAQEKLKDAGFTIYNPIKTDNNGSFDCDVEKHEETATDEDLAPPLVLTGE